MAKIAEKSAATPSSAAANGLPMFFKKPVPLNTDQHGKAGLVPDQDLAFAAPTNSILINAIEFAEVAKQYPIVFTQGDAPMPTAILGLEQQNYFVENGRWKEGAYIPAYVRKYPFVFMNVPDEDRFLLCIDEDAPQFKKGGGKQTLPFYKDGKASEMTMHALEFCTAFHNHYQMTQQFCEAVKAADLLMPSQSNAKLFNGREINLGGFQVIDEKKVAALSDDKILDFHKKGWLPLLYFALMSTSNWRVLVDMAAAKERRA
jgi:hypothetical protein